MLICMFIVAVAHDYIFYEKFALHNLSLIASIVRYVFGKKKSR